MGDMWGNIPWARWKLTRFRRALCGRGWVGAICKLLTINNTSVYKIMVSGTGFYLRGAPVRICPTCVSWLLVLYDSCIRWRARKHSGPVVVRTKDN